MNNTLTEAEKSKDKAKETEKGKESEIYSDKDINKTKGKGQENITDVKESFGGKDINIGHENTTTVYREDKYTSTIPKKTVPKDRNEEDLEDRNTGSEKPTGGSEDKVDRKDPDNSLNTVEKKEPEVVKPPERKGSPDFDKGQTDMETVPKKDKGQEEKERKEEQVNGQRDPDKVGPNDTKLRTIISESENTVEWEMTKNNTLAYDTNDKRKENNTIGSLEPGTKIMPTIFNTTLYRAGGEESVKPEKDNEKKKEDNQSFTGKIH